MASSLYPGFIKIQYTSNGHSHVQVEPVIPRVSGGSWEVQRYDGTWEAWGTAVTAYAAYLQAFFHTADTIIGAELYTLASPTASPVFEDAVPLGLSGTVSGADVAWAEYVMTARAAAGGMLRLYLMETTFPVDLRSDFPSGNADADALAGYFLLGACIIYARNGAKVILPLRYTTKINDALRKRYFLDS